MVSLSNIDKTYGKGENALHVLKNISLCVEEGEFVSILGASGSGKSTLMNIIGCMDTPDGGEYYLNGASISLLSENELAKTRNLQIGFVFQKYHLLPQYNVLLNVMMPLLVRGESAKTAGEKAKECIEGVGLADRVSHLPRELSGGQQQRVAIARALVTKPSLLLADEPTGALDAQTGKEILQLFAKLNSGGNTIIQITHDTNVAKAASRIINLCDGEIA